MDRHYGGVIWTNHALQRLSQRGIKQSDAWTVWRKPDQSRYATSKSAWIYYKTFGSEKIEVVAKQNENREWLILSVWSKNINSGKTSKKKSLLKVFLEKIFG